MVGSTAEAGLGDSHARFKVYIANRPNFANYNAITRVNALAYGEIDAIGKSCGNGWRKVFNVYAKLVFALNADNIVSLHQAITWQEFRDKVLLQTGSNTSLLFTPPQLSCDSIHLVMGKAYAKSLGLTLDWINNDFAIDLNARVIVCPYFDYRQLSNIKIVALVELLKALEFKPSEIEHP